VVSSYDGELDIRSSSLISLLIKKLQGSFPIGLVFSFTSFIQVFGGIFGETGAYPARLLGANLAAPHISLN
jgi:hypothetical protein